VDLSLCQFITSVALLVVVLYIVMKMKRKLDEVVSLLKAIAERRCSTGEVAY
jgi:hypothetical protein